MSMITAELIGERETILRLTGMPVAVHRELVTESYAQAQDLRSLMIQKLSGEVLQVRTGFLKSHVFADVKDSENQVYGEVYVSGVKYASIHEFGGTTPAHDILPKNGKALAFLMGGQNMVFRKVHHPGSKIPERSYARTALRERRKAIILGLTQAVIRGANAA